jgi:predicted O-methyltransferase YrrM
VFKCWERGRVNLTITLAKIKEILKSPSSLVGLTHGRSGIAARYVALKLKDSKQLYSQCFHLDIEAITNIFLDKMYSRNAVLYPLVRKSNARVVVETGVSNGVSTAYILAALQDKGGGRLYSIDLPNIEYELEGRTHRDRLYSSTGSFVPRELRESWTLIFGDARVELPKLLNSLDSIDLFHHDSMHTYDHMTFEYEAAWPKLRDGGILASDDVQWNSAFMDLCQRKGVAAHVNRGTGFCIKS